MRLLTYDLVVLHIQLEVIIFYDMNSFLSRKPFGGAFKGEWNNHTVISIKANNYFYEDAIMRAIKNS